MASPPEALAPNPNPPNHTDSVYAVVTVFCILSFIALVLRLVSRSLKKVPLYYDDFLAVAAWVCLTEANLTFYG